jgi:hypothetical protein
MYKHQYDSLCVHFDREKRIFFKKIKNTKKKGDGVITFMIYFKEFRTLLMFS